MWCNIFDIIYNRIIVFWCRLEHSELKTQIKLNVKSTIRSLTDEERCLKKEGKVKAIYILLSGLSFCYKASKNVLCKIYSDKFALMSFQ